MWGAPGAHIITKRSKNMQVSGQVHVVQLPALEDSSICPVTALRSIVSTNPDHSDHKDHKVLSSDEGFWFKLFKAILLNREMNINLNDVVVGGAEKYGNKDFIKLPFHIG